MPTGNGIASVAEAELLKPLRRVNIPWSYGLQQLVLAFFESYADVSHFLLNYLL